MSGLLWLMLSTVLFLFDQLTKIWALQELAPIGTIPVIGFLKFTYVENRGAAFGIFQGHTSLLAAVTLAVLCGAVWLLFSKHIRLPMEKLCVSLVIAGGAGNLFDRVTRGFVVDFIDINALFSYPMFNLADCFVVMGACMIILAVFMEETAQKKKLAVLTEDAEILPREESAMKNDGMIFPVDVSKMTAEKSKSDHAGTGKEK